MTFDLAFDLARFNLEWLESLEEVRYHGGCNDGWCAAFAVAHLLKKPDLDLRAVAYGQPLEPITKRTLFVDWCPPSEWLEEQDPELVGIIDHHATAEGTIFWWRGKGGRALYDADHSGAYLACECLIRALSSLTAERLFVPWYVLYVEDRDLWRWSLPKSREVNAYLATIPHTLADWAGVGSANWVSPEVVHQGTGALKAIDEYVKKTAAQGFLASIDKHDIPIVNASYQHGSEVADELMRTTGADMAAYFFLRPDGKWQYGFRSRAAIDCSVVAKASGGGGHKNAAGCQTNGPIHEYIGPLNEGAQR